VSLEAASKMMAHIDKQLPKLAGRKFGMETKELRVVTAENFSYVDPIDNSTSSKQVLLRV